MKPNINIVRNGLVMPGLLLACLLMTSTPLFAQEDTTAAEVTEEAAAPVKSKPVKNTFQSVWIIDNQTVMVPVKKTLEMDIMHRFGTIENGYDDFWGFFAPSNIRLGMSYSPIDKLNLGFGITKSNMLWDVSAKYAILTQTTNNKIPVSVTYYGNMAYDTRKNPDNSIFKYNTERLSFFNQLIIARKITDKFSLQVAPSLSHQNSVPGFYTGNDSATKKVYKSMKHDHFAISVAGRYKVTNVTSIIFNYDQPLTEHPENNPNPNLSFGVEFNTSSHSFQLFFGNYYYLNQQRNNLFNTNSPFGYEDETKTHPDRKTDNPNTQKDESKRVNGGRFLIGFNITRLWNY